MAQKNSKTKPPTIFKIQLSINTLLTIVFSILFVTQGLSVDGIIQFFIEITLWSLLNIGFTIYYLIKGYNSHPILISGLFGLFFVSVAFFVSIGYGSMFTAAFFIVLFLYSVLCLSHIQKGQSREDAKYFASGFLLLACGFLIMDLMMGTAEFASSKSHDFQVRSLDWFSIIGSGFMIALLSMYLIKPVALQIRSLYRKNRSNK